MPIPQDLLQALLDDRLVPYLGPGLLPADGDGTPASSTALASRLTTRVTVPHKIRNRLTAAAQYIENFKHRKTLSGLMTQAFSAEAPVHELLRQLAALPRLSLLVSAWYDDALPQALAGRSDWGMVQGWSQSEHFGQWYGYYRPDGAPAGEEDAGRWSTLLYQPLGCVRPAANWLVSDSDYVEVLTEIDIQTPVPMQVQRLRSGRGFLFLGCRFDDQLVRTFARQIMKRSSDRHFAVFDAEPTRNEQRFLAEQRIERLPMTAEAFSAALAQELAALQPTREAAGMSALA